MPSLGELGLFLIRFNQKLATELEDIIIAQESEGNTNTNRIVGTYGYIPPKYVMKGLFSIKSDIYSFGILILEIVSGGRNNSFYDANDPVNLVGQAWELWKGGAAAAALELALYQKF
ncbi:hypothetical protein K1719_012691 [Acacia pycnantha]|nr:hypothetical protein K1719_012691 [Acacia pycnantha]